MDKIEELKNNCEPEKIEKMKEIAAEFAALKEVNSVVLSGSVTSKSNQTSSDFDIYVYLNEEYSEIPVKTREKIAQKYAKPDFVEINNQFWETGDEWVENETDTVFDIMYRTPEWIKGVVDYSLKYKNANVGYSTCFIHNIKNSVVLFDTNGWYTQIQEQILSTPYTEELIKAIFAKNYPILRNTISSYKQQLKKAIDRDDIISVNHRLTAFFASYFDIIFALNKVYHPGEKRLIQQVKKYCKDYPQKMESEVNKAIKASINKPQELTQILDELMDNFDDFSKRNSFIKISGETSF